MLINTLNTLNTLNYIKDSKFKVHGVNSNYTYKLYVYGLNYNILRIMSGMGELAYSN